METGDMKLKNRGEKVLSYQKKQSEGVRVQWKAEGRETETKLCDCHREVVLVCERESE